MKILPAPTVFLSPTVTILLLVPLLTMGNVMCAKKYFTLLKELLTNAALVLSVLWEVNK